MRITLLAAALLASAAVAQVPNYNTVQRNCSNWLWTAGAHPTTANLYPDARANPPQHSTAGQTVPQGTLSWRILDCGKNSRFETRQISGFRAAVAPSSATATFPTTMLQVPEMKIHATVLDPNQILVPDTSVAPLFTLPASPWAAGSFGFFYLSIDMMTVAPVPGGPANADLAVSAMYNQNDNRDVPQTLSMWGSAFEIMTAQPQYGFIINNTNTYGVNTSANGTCLAHTIKEDQPVLNLASSWGVNPTAATQAPPGVGYGPATYESTLATTAGTLMFEVKAQNRDGDFAVLLFNLGQKFKFGFPILGQTIEVFPGDPLLDALSVLSGTIANGELMIQSLPLPVVARLAGREIGMEAVLVDTLLLVLSGSTQAVWVKI